MEGKTEGKAAMYGRLTVFDTGNSALDDTRSQTEFKYQYGVIVMRGKESAAG